MFIKLCDKVLWVHPTVLENGIWGMVWICAGHAGSWNPHRTVLIAASRLMLTQRGKKAFWSPLFSFETSRETYLSSPQDFNWTFWGVSLVGALDDASDTTIFKRENIVTISFRQKEALLCIYTSRDQCSEHSHVKWRFSLHKECFFSEGWHRGFQCSGSALDKHSFVLWECRETDRSEAGRQAESERQAEAVGSSAVSSGMKLAPQLPTEPVVFLGQRTPRLSPPRDLHLLWSAACLRVLCALITQNETACSVKLYGREVQFILNEPEAKKNHDSLSHSESSQKSYFLVS